MAFVVGTSCSKGFDSGTRSIPGGTSLLNLSRSGPSDAYTNAIKVPGMDMIATGVTGPGGDLVLIDAEGRTVAAAPSSVVVIAPGHGKGQVLVLEFISLRLFQAPQLRVIESLAVMPEAELGQFLMFPRHLCRVRTGWCILAQDGKLQEILCRPFGVGRHASMEMPSATECAFDAKTDSLVVIGRDGEIRALDWRTLNQLHRLRVPGIEFSNSVCAHGGRAWIGTRRGSILCYDIAKNVVTDEISITSPKGEVELDLSESADRLAATSSIFVSGSNHPTALTTWDIGTDGLIHRVRADTNLRSTIFDIGLLDRQEKLFIASPYPAHIWAYGSARDP